MPEVVVKIRTPQRLCVPLAASLLVLLAGFIVVLVAWDPDSLFELGLAMMLFGAIATATTIVSGLALRRHAAVDEIAARAHEEGRSLGYQQGFREGRRVGRPRVVRHMPNTPPAAGDG